MDIALNQAGFFQHFQMLRHGGIGNGQLCGNIAGEATAMRFEKAQDDYARRVREGFGVPGGFYFDVCVCGRFGHAVALKMMLNLSSCPSYRIASWLPAVFAAVAINELVLYCFRFRSTGNILEQNFAGETIKTNGSVEKIYL